MGRTLRAILVWGLCLLAVGAVAYALLSGFEKVEAVRHPYWKVPLGVTLVPPPANTAVSVPSSNLTGSDLRLNKIAIQRVDEARRLLEEIRKVTIEQHLTFLGHDHFDPENGSIDSISYPRLTLRTQDAEFDFAYPSGSNIVCFNWVAENATEQPDTEPARASWTPQQAIQVASAFRAVLVDVPKFNFDTPTASYRADFNYKSTKEPMIKSYKPGEWEVSWIRTDGKGHRFGSDFVRITLSERTGLKSATVYLDDDYKEFAAKPMDREIAVDIARASHPAMGTPGNDIDDYRVTSAELEIVEPYMQSGTPCRLAWVIQLQPVRKNPVNYMDAQIVFVDALTGQIIGNDAFL